MYVYLCSISFNVNILNKNANSLKAYLKEPWRWLSKVLAMQPQGPKFSSQYHVLNRGDRRPEDASRILALGLQRQDKSSDLLASLVEPVSSRLSEDMSQKLRWEVTGEENQCLFLAHLHTCARTHTHRILPTEAYKIPVIFLKYVTEFVTAYLSLFVL